MAEEMNRNPMTIKTHKYLVHMKDDPKYIIIIHTSYDSKNKEMKLIKRIDKYNTINDYNVTLHEFTTDIRPMKEVLKYYNYNIYYIAPENAGDDALCTYNINNRTFSKICFYRRNCLIGFDIQSQNNNRTIIAHYIDIFFNHHKINVNTQKALKSNNLKLSKKIMKNMGLAAEKYTNLKIDRYCYFIEDNSFESNFDRILVIEMTGKTTRNINFCLYSLKENKMLKKVHIILLFQICLILVYL